MTKNILAFTVICLLAAFLPASAAAETRPAEFSRTLTDGWLVQSSAKVTVGGDRLSQAGFAPQGWQAASVPTTVLSALVKNGVYKNIFFADNLKSVPEDPFKVSWWFRTEFDLPAPAEGQAVSLEFDGINYRANIWLNGKKVGDASRIYGSFRRFALEVTEAARPGEKNVLAVEVFPPRPGEPTFGFVDWNPPAPDRGLGLWRPVRVRTTGGVSIRHPFVTSVLDLQSFREADLTVSAELENHSARSVDGTLEARIEQLALSVPVSLKPREVRKVVLAPADHPELKVKDPRVWWTHDWGRPELYSLDLSFRAGGRTLDARRTRFGIREVSDYMDERGARGFKLNGRKILIRGGGWTDDLLMNNPYPSVKAQVEYARQMNLNALRLEGFWGTSPDLYDLCDETGILIMVGWSCQWEWDSYLGKPTDEKYGGINTPALIRLVAESWRDQVRWLRNHPSIFVWMEGSDLLPEPSLEREYARILAEDDPSRPSVKSAKSWTSEISGPTGVKMAGPYDYVSPNYWYLDTQNGGAFGFNTETGPGPQVPPVESLKRMFPEKALWPINPLWTYHCCRNEFENLDRYNQAMDRRLGPPQDLRDYLAKAQFLNYEGMRAMYEAFVSRRPRTTGIIQWMYNSAWPKLWWQLYDYFLLPNGAFFGARKANEPVHLLYDYGTGEVLASNNTLGPSGRLKAALRLLDLDGRVRWQRELDIELKPEEVKVLAAPPQAEGFGPTYFLDLRLNDAAGRAIGTNFYALSTRPDVLDEAASTWFVTPLKGFADLTGLQKLPPVELQSKSRFSPAGASAEVEVELANPSAHPAFMIELLVVDKSSGAAVAPIFWEDDYLTLLPGEKRTVRARFPAGDLDLGALKVKVGGWNVR
jgi:exo-1,4-beta-D-glucosaminidase